MLYRKTVDNILSQFHITDVKFNRMIHQMTFSLENENFMPFEYVIDKPLYYTLQAANSTTYTKGESDTSLILPTDLIDRYENYLRVLPDATAYDSAYLANHKTLKTDTWYANEYWNRYDDANIAELMSISGLGGLTVSKVFGKFILTTDNKLRFLFDPVSIVKEEVEHVYQSDLFLYDANGKTYVVYYVLFRDIYGAKFIIYHSGIINQIASISAKVIPLVDYFTNYDNLLVVYNIFNLGIFENKPVGCKRLIVNGFNKSFFYQAFNNYKLNTDVYAYDNFFDSDTPISGFMPNDLPNNAKIINSELLGLSSIAFKEVESNNAVGDLIFSVGELDLNVTYYI